MKNTADISRMSICWNRAFDTSMKKLNQMAVTELFHCLNTYIFHFFVTFRPFIKKILTLCPFSRTNTYIFSIFIRNTYTFSFWRRNDTHCSTSYGITKSDFEIPQLFCLNSASVQGIRNTIVHFLVFPKGFFARHPLHLAKRRQPPSRRSR